MCEGIQKWKEANRGHTHTDWITQHGSLKIHIRQYYRMLVSTAFWNDPTHISAYPTIVCVMRTVDSALFNDVMTVGVRNWYWFHINRRFNEPNDSNKDERCTSKLKAIISLMQCDMQFGSSVDRSQLKASFMFQLLLLSFVRFNYMEMPFEFNFSLKYLHIFMHHTNEKLHITMRYCVYLSPHILWLIKEWN